MFRTLSADLTVPSTLWRWRQTEDQLNTPPTKLGPSMAQVTVMHSAPTTRSLSMARPTAEIGETMLGTMAHAVLSSISGSPINGLTLIQATLAPLQGTIDVKELSVEMEAKGKDTKASATRTGVTLILTETVTECFLGQDRTMQLTPPSPSE